MLRKLTAARFLALLMILAFPALARGQVLADRVPDDTILYVGWTGVEAPGPGFKGSNLEAILKSSNLPQVFDQFIPALLDMAARQDKNSAEGVRIFRAVAGPMWRHPSAIAFAGIDMAGPNGPMPKFVLISKAGKEAPALKQQIDALLAQAGQPPVPVHVVQQGDIVAVAVGYATADAALPGGAGGGNAKSLAKDASFIKALAQVDKNAVITGYVDVEKLLATIDQIVPMAGQEAQVAWPTIRDSLGIAGVKQIIWSEGFDGKDWGERAFMAAPAPRKGLIGSLLEAKPLTDDILKTIPQSSTLAGAGHFDLNGFVTTLRTAVASLDPDTARQVDQAFGQVNQLIGMDVQKDLLANFGDEWAYYTDPATAGVGMMGLTLVNRPADAAKLEAALTRLENLANQMSAQHMKQGQDPMLRIRQVKMAGATIHFLGSPAISPAWTIQDGNLYAGLYPEAVAAAVAQGGGNGHSILDNRAFVAIRQHLGAKSATSVQFMDLPKLAPYTYPGWQMMSRLAGLGDLFGVPAPVMILPPLKELMPHLSAAGQAAWGEADGLHMRSVSPFPGSEALGTDPDAMSVGQEAMAISVLLPALNSARDRANRVKSASNLRQIGLGAIMYANNQRDGSFPKDEATMLKNEDLTLEVFINPRTTTQLPHGLTPEQQQAWVAQHSDYVWNGAGKKNNMPADEPLAWEKPEGAREGLNILYGDCHVEWKPMGEAMEIIRKAQAKKNGAGGNL
ncbi:MAG TPA: DUF3352 domain-containing protein [Tepidisphaeraceae bacterium]|nr:DUF3352 domain-containing protein [Tepidisphaeraceae bacterium]